MDQKINKKLVDLYRETGRRAGHAPDKLKVGIHAIGFVADTMEHAADEFFPGYAAMFTQIGKERGWPPTTRAQYDALRGARGALIVGDPDTVAEKVLRYDEVLGGIARLNFQMSAASLSHPEMLRAIELLGERVAPAVRKAGVAVHS